MYALMSIQSEVETLMQELRSADYEITGYPNKFRTSPHVLLPEIVYSYKFMKKTGTGRRDVNAGFLYFNNEGQVGFDVFTGGSKYGNHLNSYQDEFDVYGWTFTPDLKGILSHLGVGDR